MGALTSFASLSRAAGPVVVSTLYRTYGTYTVMFLTLSMLVLAFIFKVMVFKRLVPFGQGPHFVREDQEDQENTHL